MAKWQMLTEPECVPRRQHYRQVNQRLTAQNGQGRHRLLQIPVLQRCWDYHQTKPWRQGS